jgi:class 3 adenylate cyclase
MISPEPSEQDLSYVLENRAQVEEFRRKHRTGLLTLVFTDIVGSTALKQGLRKGSVLEL